MFFKRKGERRKQILGHKNSNWGYKAVNIIKIVYQGRKKVWRGEYNRVFGECWGNMPVSSLSGNDPEK